MPDQPALRSQLLRWLIYPLFALLTVDTAISYGVAYRFARDAHDKALVEIVRELSLQIRTNAENQAYLDLPDSIKRVLFHDPHDPVIFQVIDANAQTITGEAIAAPALSDRPARGGEILYDVRVGNVDMRAVQIATFAPTEIVLRVAEGKNRRRSMANEILLAVVLPQLLLIGLVALIVRVGVTRGLLPLDELQRAIALRSHRDRSPLQESRVPAEVKPLVISINGLLDRLDKVMTLQSRFIADAAHQLKTPVAGLKAQVELLARNPDGHDRGLIIARLEIGVERMSRLVSQLLSLAKNEPEAAKLIDFKPIDLNELMLDIASQWVPLALRRDIDLGFEPAESPALVTGDANRLRELFEILIDNAIRYSQSGGSVTVRVDRTPSPRVSVSDDSPRIPLEEKQRIFERFHRLLGTGDGSGLGLAIAQEIAALHRASIHLADDEYDGVGNVFSVVFPG